MDGLKDNFDVYEQNRNLVSNDANFRELLDDIQYTKKFIYNFDFHNFNRSCQMDREYYVFSIDNILNSAHRTLNSVQVCCENCNLADANTLIRKYRDDLFFYLYVLYVNSNSDILSEKEISKHEKNIIKWRKDNLKDLNINEILIYIGKSSTAKEAISKHNLQKTLKKVNDDLNNFVHSNGKSFYNRSYQYYLNTNSIKENTEKIQYEIDYITSIFLFLLILIRGDYISSTYYIDNLEMGIEPIEGSQYFVAPFVSEYINTKMALVSKEWIKYLKDKSFMDI